MTGKQCNGIPDNDNSCNGSDGSNAELISFYYKWEQQHLEAETIAEDYIYTCREAAYAITHLNSINEIPQRSNRQNDKGFIKL